MTYSRGLLAKSFSFYAYSSLSFSASVTGAAAAAAPPDTAAVAFESGFGPAPKDNPVLAPGASVPVPGLVIDGVLAGNTRGFVSVSPGLSDVGLTLKRLSGFAASDGLAAGWPKRPFSGLVSGLVG